MTRREAFTLIELILALALAVVLISLVCSALYTHARMVDASRWDIEESQLARNLLRMIANDLRGAVWPQPFDASSLDSIANLPPASNAGDSAEGRGETDEAEEPDDSGTADSESAAEVSAAETDSASSAGLYGDQYGLEIDVIRRPRFDQFLQNTVGEMLSDVERITYFVQSSAAGPATSLGGPGAIAAGPAIGGDLPAGETPSGEGLVRHKLDRAAADWAVENGSPEFLNTGGQLLAPEVIGLEFRYFDGTQWVVEWDSSARDGLPIAVEIALQFAPREIETPAAESLSPAAFLEDEGRIYRLLVHLPTASTDQSTGGAVESGAVESGASEP